jgi:hypothetical protein
MKLRISSKLAAHRKQIISYLKMFDIPQDFEVNIRHTDRPGWRGRAYYYRHIPGGRKHYFKIVLTLPDINKLEAAWMHEWNHVCGFGHRDIA